MPLATAPQDPPEEPPVIRVGSCGLREAPSCTFSPVKSMAYRPILSAPTRTAPAASSFSINGHLLRRRISAIDLRAGNSRDSRRRQRTFSTGKGTPASGPGFYSLRAASIALARSRARSAVTAVNAFSVGSRSLIRANASLTTAVAVVWLDATPAAISLAVDHAVSTSAVRLKDWAQARHHPAFQIRRQVSRV